MKQANQQIAAQKTLAAQQATVEPTLKINKTFPYENRSKTRS